MVLYISYQVWELYILSALWMHSNLFEVLTHKDVLKFVVCRICTKWKGDWTFKVT